MITKFITNGNVSYTDIEAGRYWKLSRDKLQEDIARSDEHVITRIGFSPYPRKYLLKIADLCKSKDVTLILINVPIYKPEIYGNTDDVDAFFNTYLQGTIYADYSAFSLPDSCRGDIGHLNYKGAELFSQYLQEHLSTDVATTTHFRFVPSPSMDASSPEP
jgi:hypothetical protein